MVLTDQSTDKALLDAEHELWRTSFSYIKSMAIKSALDLRLADAIHHHGGSATLSQIVARVTLHPSKISCMRRLMRVLTLSSVFTIQPDGGGGEPLYALTPLSRLLVGSQNSASIMAFVLNPVLVTPFLGIGEWFQHALPDPSFFEHTHGKALWEMAGHDAALDVLVNSAMVSDSRFIMDIAVREAGDVFRGLSSLVDIGGGLGAAAQVISEAFPHVECSVLDLEHVVSNAPTGTNVKYVAGDMFQSVPPANAAFLKSVLHDWDDEKCVQILKSCRKAIPPREAGGKVIIVDIVVGAGHSGKKHKEVHALLDLYIMFINGIERDEQEWSKIFLEAGYSDYNIIPVLGFRSIIEVYP
ncbi:O-methyltransferase ZRP4-like isoform X2 [Lolium rigidum]|uniref:O-methyltransferase ZRP4-like isoform X2 n=1 Tax=Lolium rigidum TaxID=89674 RepID=UPI001F5C477A|nr:O-methyltransferase ZRP4-like isoform X2 [Lolium rigidum]